MVNHIVMWNFKAEITEEEKVKLKEDMKRELVGLVGKIPGLIKADFIDQAMESSTHDIALLSLLDSQDDLIHYQTHPDHVYVADTFVRPFVCDRCCLDYEQ